MVVAANGGMYFTDASRPLCTEPMGRHLRSERARHSGAAGNWVACLSTTRQRVAPASSHEGLAFANGIALSKDEQTLFVNETGKYRVWKIATGANDLDLSGGAVASGATVLSTTCPVTRTT